MQPLLNCRNIVGEIGTPCQECVDAFGDMLQHNPGGAA